MSEVLYLLPSFAARVVVELGKIVPKKVSSLKIRRRVAAFAVRSRRSRLLPKSVRSRRGVSVRAQL
jgi:hypothetical protein